MSHRSWKYFDYTRVGGAILLRARQHERVLRNLAALAFLIWSPAMTMAQTAAPPSAVPTLPAEANYANENTDWGVPPQSALAKVAGARTPTTIPGGKVLSTRQLADALRRKDRLIMLDAWADAAHETIPGAHRVWFAGNSGAFDDVSQAALSVVLKRFTGGDLSYPVVVFCTSSECWESYNAALRVAALGYRDIRWYRGGLTAWNAAHQPLSGEYGLDQFLR